MSTLRSLTLVCFAGLSLLACRPAEGDEPPAPVSVDDGAQALAAQICAGLFECSCAEVELYADEAQCVQILRVEFQAAIDEELVTGGTWDEACAGQLVATWSDWACLGPSAAFDVARFDARECPVLKGTGAPAAPCSISALGDSCSPGLSCAAGECIEDEIPVPIGQPCEYQWDQLPCASGGYCTYDNVAGERLCKAIPKLDDPCDPAEDLLCGPSGLELVCNAASSTCEYAPGIGEPCFEGFLCGPGAYCDGGEDFTCQALFEVGETCAANAVCMTDASCVDGVCTDQPAQTCDLAYLSI